MAIQKLYLYSITSSRDESMHLAHNDFRDANKAHVSCKDRYGKGGRASAQASR
jgi:hypothetical protein